ncbi:MAG: Ldh family oxidoreductase [Alphaproteobacteria bacterium]|nr:Ldh family oxidoreductase [Alphaproteobacteria bacterium]
MPIISRDQLCATITAALTASNTAPAHAGAVARALTLAEIDGKKGHGLSRVPSYAGQAKSGKVDGHVAPQMSRPKPAVLAIDAGHGFAYPAFELMADELPKLAAEMGVAMAGVYRSHHYGVAGHHVERAADQGMVALLFGNTPAAMAPWGGKTPLMGTNPIAFAAPIAGRPPMVIDLATSKVARGNIMAAHQRGEDIPEGWALDQHGAPTTDSGAALNGTMVPLGDAKGAALALMIEVLAAAVTGAGFGHQASSFFEADGTPPNTGQMMLMIDPGAMAPNFAERLAGLAALIEGDGARLPGGGRMAKRAAADAGIEVNDKAWQAALDLAAGA